MADGGLRGINPNGLDARAAMALPPGVVRRTAKTLLAADPGLGALSPETLVLIAEAPDAPHERRLAAASLLGLLGDPRIDVLDPRMIAIPGGTATLGSSAGEVETTCAEWADVGVQRDWILKEFPPHQLEIAPFRIGRHPVTNIEYLAFLEDTGGSDLPSSWRFGTYPAHLSNHPVWTVTPADADAYAAWLAARTGRAFRLPTEAEWEFAAAGPDRLAFPWGDMFDPARANTVEAGPLQTTPIGIYPAGASPFGILDMGGNVEEFVACEYRPYPGGPPVQDDLARTGTYRVARGGSFSRFGDLARSRRRHGWYDRDLYAIGFRLAEDG